jgi:hypothetical protein
VSIGSYFRLLLAPAALAGLLTACGDDETAPEDHTPVEYTALIDGEVVEAPVNLVFGETVRVRFQFFNAAGHNLDDVADSHFAGLTFDPASLATVTRVADRNYEFDVTGAVVGSGTAQIGYGHSEDADETILDAAVPVNVIAGTGENPE